MSNIARETRQIRSDRDELIAQCKQLTDGMSTMAYAIGRLMEDRVRYVTALRKIALMTETGIMPKGGVDIYRYAREALDAEPDMSWWPDGQTAPDDGMCKCGHPVYDHALKIPEGGPGDCAEIGCACRKYERRATS